MRRILVLKGGGVRGILQLSALEILEKHYNKKICEIFDLIVGTSVGSMTGGILATGRYDMAKYYDLFVRYIPRIFKRRRGLGLFHPIYKRENFYKMWADLFGDDPPLMGDCKTKFLCTSVDLCDFRTHYFKSWDKKDGTLELKEAIARSFAAPYYFGPVVDRVNKSVYVDGGAGDSNTPLNIAYAESINQGWYRSRVEFTVLGTGVVDYSSTFEKAQNINLYRQMMAFLNPREGGLARIQSTINQISHMEIIAKAESLISFNYYDVEIGPEYSGIDRTEHIQAYKAFGNIIAAKVDKDLSEIEDLIPMV
ncbi:MAG: patatin-like phospholipase family protein [Promethearchaeota archaeon]